MDVLARMRTVAWGGRTCQDRGVAEKQNRRGLVARIRAELGLYRSILADPRCPRLARWLLAAAVAYALSPVDLIPDVIPGLGHLDDAVIVPGLVWLALRLIPRDLVLEHRERGRGATGTG
jgi:uncharacterized membrane protein YkvA (DUF1232 family)